MPAATGVNATGLRGHSLLYSVSVFLSIGVWLFGCVPPLF